MEVNLDSRWDVCIRRMLGCLVLTNLRISTFFIGMDPRLNRSFLDEMIFNSYQNIVGNFQGTYDLEILHLLLILFQNMFRLTMEECLKSYSYLNNK